MFVLLIVVFASIILVGCEREGSVEFEDCREFIQIDENSFSTFYKTFTCTYEKTDNGDIMSGLCVRVELTKNNECKKAFAYEKSAYKECPEGEYLDKVGECYCNVGVKRGGECISHNENCSNTFGENTYGVKADLVDKSSCSCSSGYEWNEDGDACIITSDERCKQIFKNSIYESIGSDGILNCGCRKYYKWNQDSTACIIDINF